MSLVAAFDEKGWVRLPFDPSVAAWCTAARPEAERLLADPDLRGLWLRCGGTWFAGVNVLENDANGAVVSAEIPELPEILSAAVRDVAGFDHVTWDRAQISACLPGYPQPWSGETEAAFRYRRDRDAAHVDGLLPTGPDRRRVLGETHGFVLGLPLTDAPIEASPLVVFEGSHEIIREAFRDRFAGVDPADWPGEDVTDAYVAVRRHIFETCPRVLVHARPGEAYLVHRLTLHGVAPWRAPEGMSRIIAYFRPDPLPEAVPAWWIERR